MKRLIFCAALAAMASSAFAADATGPVYVPNTTYLTDPTPISHNPVSGHVEGYIGATHWSQDGDSETGTSYGAAGRLNYNFNRNWNVQGDLFFDGLSIDEADIHSFGAAAHMFWRQPSSFALGGFVSVESIDLDDDDVTRWVIGPEGQVYFGNVTLYGQAYYGRLRDDGESLDTWGGRGIVRYFFTENVRVDGELGFRTIEGFGDSLTTFTAAAQGNYRFTGTPLTAFGRYQFDSVSGEGDADLHKFVVGLKATFGADTLLEEDRHGATMDTPTTNLIAY